MAKKQQQEWMSFHEDGKRYMQCKICKSEYVSTSKDVVSVTCWKCVQLICTSQMSLEEMMPSLRKKVSTGRPAGWHFMNEFVDKDGNVFHKGVEQPELKGTLPSTKVTKSKVKTKRRTKEQILIDRHNKKKAALKKAVQKQKDFLNHNINKG